MVDAHVNCMSCHAQSCANAQIVRMGHLKMSRPTWLHPIQADSCTRKKKAERLLHSFIYVYVMLCSFVLKFFNATHVIYIQVTVHCFIQHCSSNILFFSFNC